MNVLFFLSFLALIGCVLLLLVGLLLPTRVPVWGKKTRGSILVKYGLSVIVLFITTAIIATYVPNQEDEPVVMVHPQEAETGPVPPPEPTPETSTMTLHVPSLLYYSSSEVIEALGPPTRETTSQNRLHFFYETSEYTLELSYPQTEGPLDLTYTPKTPYVFAEGSSDETRRLLADIGLETAIRGESTAMVKSYQYYGNQQNQSRKHEIMIFAQDWRAVAGGGKSRVSYLHMQLANPR